MRDAAIPLKSPRVSYIARDDTCQANSHSRHRAGRSRKRQSPGAYSWSITRSIAALARQGKLLFGILERGPVALCTEEVGWGSGRADRQRGCKRAGRSLVAAGASLLRLVGALLLFALFRARFADEVALQRHLLLRFVVPARPRAGDRELVMAGRIGGLEMNVFFERRD